MTNSCRGGMFPKRYIPKPLKSSEMFQETEQNFYVHKAQSSKNVGIGAMV